MVDLCHEGIQQFPDDAQLYICPLFYASGGFVVPDPESTHFVLTVEESPLPEPTGFKACLSPFRRPAADMAPTEAKAACLYPNVSRAVAVANDRGFDTGVMLDPDGNVAEFSSANLFMVKDGVVHTPEINGTFLNGITRQRVIQLLNEAGVEVVERPISYEELTEADELFATGNYSKVIPCVSLDGQPLPEGPVFQETRDNVFQLHRRLLSRHLLIGRLPISHPSAAERPPARRRPIHRTVRFACESSERRSAGNYFG